jgi:hypothetical protein
MSRNAERIYPYGAAIVLAVLFWGTHLSFPVGQDILSASITLGAVFTGFLATLNSMVIGLQGPRMRRFKNTKFFLLLLVYLKEAIWSSLAFCALSLGGFFYDPTKPPSWFGIVWVLLGVTTILTFQRASSVLVRLIQSSE